MNRTLKLLSAGVVSVLGLAVLGVALWEWQKDFWPHTWMLAPVSNQEAEIYCSGFVPLGIWANLYSWQAEEWKCQERQALNYDRYSAVLVDPNCQVVETYRIECSEPNQFLEAWVNGNF